MYNLLLLFFHIIAVALAITRDGSSGGVVRIGIIDGVTPEIERRVYTEDTFPKFYF